MSSTQAIIIGAGQAGLAMSACLTQRGIEHVVLERGRVAERWQGERWDSLRLLTPNWASRLPGWTYQGHDPNGFMSASAFARHLNAYARHSAAPVETGTTVQSVRRDGNFYVVKSERRQWRASSVILATGHCDVPAVPLMARRLPAFIQQITPASYHHPDELLDGGVLVVGASATGAQIADEVARAGGRSVTIAAGCHTRLPRTYRGQDIWSWLEAIGILDDRWDTVRDIGRARRQPSFQLVGRDDRQTLNLATLHDAGVRVVGRVSDIGFTKIRLDPELPATLDATQAALHRLLARIDILADRQDAPADCTAAAPIVLPSPPDVIDLVAEDIRTVIWATGYRRNYNWLHVPVLDADQEIIHDGGITPSPGLYVLGLRFMRRRRSNFIDGVGRDAEDLSDHLAGYLSGSLRHAA